MPPTGAEVARAEAALAMARAYVVGLSGPEC